MPAKAAWLPIVASESRSKKANGFRCISVGRYTTLLTPCSAPFTISHCSRASASSRPSSLAPSFAARSASAAPFSFAASASASPTMRIAVALASASALVASARAVAVLRVASASASLRVVVLYASMSAWMRSMRASLSLFTRSILRFPSRFASSACVFAVCSACAEMLDEMALSSTLKSPMRTLSMWMPYSRRKFSCRRPRKSPCTRSKKGRFVVKSSTAMSSASSPSVRASRVPSSAAFAASAASRCSFSCCFRAAARALRPSSPFTPPCAISASDVERTMVVITAVADSLMKCSMLRRLPMRVMASFGFWML
mmetsp:Transcript_48796/g.150724  ORF Transcript_48796/g.150724 Transcript_48796/m.150724 type:complete len:314 (-) Transcript_48796:1659-2600(-)